MHSVVTRVCLLCSHLGGRKCEQLFVGKDALLMRCRPALKGNTRLLYSDMITVFYWKSTLTMCSHVRLQWHTLGTALAVHWSASDLVPAFS